MPERVGENTEIAGALERRAPNGTIFVGRDCLIEGHVVAETDESEVRIGNNVFIGNGTVIDCALSIVIEDDVLISYRGIVADHDGHSLRCSLRQHDLAHHRKRQHVWTHVAKAPVRIGKGAWIGAHAILLKGVAIGEGAIVGAGSVVTHDVPEWTVVAGNPAVVIRTIADTER